ncbi:MAG: hypothetical protein ABSE42_12470, partial [Bryobacteraceae bacterium]
PVQVISFRLAHRDSFHPSTLRLSRGTFYLAQSGTFYLAATACTTCATGLARATYNQVDANQ